MSLGIAFKGAEGIVLAADSRVTLLALTMMPGQNQPFVLPATFDNATKLLRVAGQTHVGAVTYGLGALGQPPRYRTAHSFMPEFEADLAKTGRLTTQAFAIELSKFFAKQYKDHGMPDPAPPGQDMVFLVGGYDENEPYGHVFELKIPSSPQPNEHHVNDFGMVWGGQSEFTQRLITGFDPNLPNVVKDELKITDAQKQQLEVVLRARLQAPIPFQFLPLQDCVNLAILLLRTTMEMQAFWVQLRGVGGAIDVVTITRTDGLTNIQVKKITGGFEKRQEGA